MVLNFFNFKKQYRMIAVLSKIYIIQSIGIRFFNEIDFKYFILILETFSSIT